MRPKRNPRPHPGRVIWNDSERAVLLKRAVEVRAQHPDIAGLDLLRSSMSALPSDRRRSLRAVTQVPWFEVGVIAELRRAETERVAEASILPTLERNASAVRETADMNKEFMELHAEWREEMGGWAREIMQGQQSILATLLLLLREIQIANTTMGKLPPTSVAVPVPSEVEVHAMPRLKLGPAMVINKKSNGGRSS